jgi:hypothetical protein
VAIVPALPGYSITNQGSVLQIVRLLQSANDQNKVGEGESRANT